MTIFDSFSKVAFWNPTEWTALKYVILAEMALTCRIPPCQLPCSSFFWGSLITEILFVLDSYSYIPSYTDLMAKIRFTTNPLVFFVHPEYKSLIDHKIEYNARIINFGHSYTGNCCKTLKEEFKDKHSSLHIERDGAIMFHYKKKQFSGREIL